MEDQNYVKLGLAVFSGILGAFLVASVIIEIRNYYVIKQFEEDMDILTRQLTASNQQMMQATQELFKTPKQTPKTFEAQVKIRMEQLRPEFERKEKERQQRTEILINSGSHKANERFLPEGGSMCIRYYEYYKSSPTEQNLKLAKQVCKNFK